MKQNVRLWVVCSVTAHGDHPVLRTLGVFLAALLFSALPIFAACQEVPSGPVQALPIEIVGNSATAEGTERRWVAVLRERPILDDADGYKPQFSDTAGSSTPLPTKYECPVEFRWDFGDGTGSISTGERPSITHEYARSGNFTLRVEAIFNGQIFASGQKDLVVRNLRPRFPRVAAVEINPGLSLFEITALATDVPGDPLTYEWDFGDGETAINDQWRMEHQYRNPGRYEVKVTIKDDDNDFGEGKRTIFVSSADPNEDTVGPLEETPTGAVQTSIKLSVAGGANFDFTGEIRPIAGIHLAGRGKQHGGCRFMISAWDNTHLAHIGVIMDLKGISGDGAIYTFHKPMVWFNLEPDQKRYEGAYRGLTGANVIGPGGIGEMLLSIPGVGGLSDEQRRTVGNQAGVEPGMRERQETAPTPAVSPFGIDDHEGFSKAEGEAALLFVPYDRAIGRLNVTLRNSDKKSPYQSVIVGGDFALDLEAARRDGLMLYNNCGPADLQIERVSPEDKETFVYTRTPNVYVYFSDKYAPETLDSERFQLTYPAPGHGELVPVDVRMYRRDKSAWIRPTEDLMGGVRYTARIKVGDDGVLDRGGNPIPDENGTGWYTWSFTTRPDLDPNQNSPPGTENLACQVYQTVRDAPLIANKPAVARIYANWQLHPEVHPEAQLREFVGQVTLLNGATEVASVSKRFVRPDLWASEGIKESAAEHTANLFFTPSAKFPSSLRVKLELPKDPTDTVPPTAWSRCSTPVWKLSPEITVQWYIVNVNQWNSLDVDDQVKPYTEGIVEEARTLALQLFPVSSVKMKFSGVMPYPPMIPDRWNGIHLNCDRNCVNEWISPYWPEHPVQAMAARLDYDSSATMSLYIMPARDEDPTNSVTEISGGGAMKRTGEGVPAKIIFAFEVNPDYRERYIYGLVHEMGHALWLEHLPWIENKFAQGESKRVRDEAWANGNRPAFWYAGIDGFHIARDGKSGKNKSSAEGNEESSWIAPLMYPSTMKVKDVSIARHHYLQLMQTWEKNGGISKP